MRYRKLGRTGLSVSEVSLGAGPVSGLMTGTEVDQQRAVLARAAKLGINWIDTAAGYGDGSSEENLGSALQSLPGDLSRSFHLATKVRLRVIDGGNLHRQVIDSVRASLHRLRIPKITLLQLHNAVTWTREEIPAAVTPDDILGPHGALSAFRELRDEGHVEQFGLTATGHPAALRCVIDSGEFATIQVPYHLLNPTALYPAPPGFRDTDFGQIIRPAAAAEMGVFAIRVYAAGALLDAPPSAHTLRTPYFPLALYEADRAAAARLRLECGEIAMSELALRFVLSSAEITSAIIGFGAVDHVDAAVQAASQGQLPAAWHERLVGRVTQV